MKSPEADNHLISRQKGKLTNTELAKICIDQLINNNNIYLTAIGFSPGGSRF